jgi:integrase
MTYPNPYNRPKLRKIRFLMTGNTLTILQATKDLRKVSLWLGHSSMQTTEIYTRADPSVKLEASNP